MNQWDFYEVDEPMDLLSNSMMEVVVEAGAWFAVVTNIQMHKKVDDLLDDFLL